MKFRSSPIGRTRACLCKNNTYSVKCCDGRLHAQGIGPISRGTAVTENIITEGNVNIITETSEQIITE